MRVDVDVSVRRVLEVRRIRYDFEQGKTDCMQIRGTIGCISTIEKEILVRRLVSMKGILQSLFQR